MRQSPLIVMPSLPVQNGFWAAGGLGGRFVVTQRLTACGSCSFAQSYRNWKPATTPGSVGVTLQVARSAKLPPLTKPQV